MIKIKKADIYGCEAAVRGMRNPMNSWYKSKAKDSTKLSGVTEYVFQPEKLKLDEWKDFCKWIESLPFTELITE